MAASVSDAGALTLYVDGTSVAFTTVANSGVTAAAVDVARSNSLVGKSHFGNFFTGSIRDVRVYDAPRSAGQVRADANGWHADIADVSLRLAFDLDGRLSGVSRANDAAEATAATGTYSNTASYSTRRLHPVASLDHPDGPAVLNLPFAPDTLELTVAGLRDGASERLVLESIPVATAIVLDGNTSGSFSHNSLTWAYSTTFANGVATLAITQPSATVAQWQSLLRDLGYQNTADPSSIGPRTLRVDALDANRQSLIDRASVLTLSIIAPPTLAISAAPTALRNGQTSTITFTFSEDPGSSFTASDITVSGGTLSALGPKEGDGTANNPWRYSATFTPTANFEGMGGVSVAASSFSNPAGLGNTAAASLSLALDTALPNLLRAQWVGNALHLIFNEPLDATSTPDVTSWTLTASGTAVDLDGATARVLGNMLILTLTDPQRDAVASAIAGNSFSLLYTDPSGDDLSTVVQDVAGNDWSTTTVSTVAAPSLDLNTSVTGLGDSRSFVPLRVLGALQLSGNQSVTLPGNVALSHDYTFELWAKPAGITLSQQRLLELGSGGANGNNNIMLSVVNRSSEQALGNGGKIGLKLLAFDGSYQAEYMSTAAVFSGTMTWRHIGVSVSNDGVPTLYVDGNPWSMVTVGAPTGFVVTGYAVPNLRANAFVGKSSFGNLFSGELADVRVYDSARTAAQIRDDYLGAQVDSADTSLRLAFDLDSRLSGVSNVNGSSLNTNAVGTHSGTPSYSFSVIPLVASIDNPDAPAVLNMPVCPPCA